MTVPQLLIGWLVRVLPPTIHPMVVHFPIALLYVTSLAEGLALITRSSQRDRFLDRASFWLLTLSGMAIVAAGAAGVVSEASVHLTPTTSQMLGAHQRDAVLTGFLALLAWLAQVFTFFKDTRAWSIVGSGRGRVTLVSMVLVWAATFMVSVTGHLGGTMVYQHCLGIPTGQCTPAAAHASPAMPTP